MNRFTPGTPDRRGFAARSRRRPAAVSVWLLVVLLTLLAAMAVGVNAAWLGTAYEELRGSADAAALAAAGELVSDEWLRSPRTGVAALPTAAAARAVEYAAANPVLGRPLVLQTDPLLGADIAFGAVDPAASLLTPIDPADPASWSLDTLSAVAVTARRVRSRGTAVPLLLGALVLRPTQDVQAVTVARLDRDVYGFRPGVTAPAPLVPIGVKSDLSAGAGSWEHEVRDRLGPDDWTVDPATGAVSAGGDGIPEIDVELQLAPGGDPALSTAYLLTVGAGTTTTQITAGVTRDDLAATGGMITLDASNRLQLPGTAVGPADGPGALAAIRGRLEQLLGGRPRVWPLVREFDAMTETAVVTGFIAARVVRVEVPAGGPLRVRLQPAQLAVPQALTDPAHRSPASFIPSPYLARLRLAR